MKVLLSIVVKYKKLNKPNEFTTTYWVEEVEIQPKESVRDAIAGRVHKRLRNFPRPEVGELPEVLSISHSILP